MPIKPFYDIKLKLKYLFMPIIKHLNLFTPLLYIKVLIIKLIDYKRVFTALSPKDQSNKKNFEKHPKDPPCHGVGTNQNTMY